MELEESGFEEGVAPSMDQIPVWQRVESLNFEYIASAGSNPRVELRYTLCTVKGLKIDSVPL